MRLSRLAVMCVALSIVGAAAMAFSSAGAATKVPCARGTHLDNHRCVTNPPKVTCARGTHLDNHRCVTNRPKVTCARGTHLDNHRCVTNRPRRRK